MTSSKRHLDPLSKRIGNVLNEFGGKTSIAGLANAYASESTSKKIYWGFLFLVGLVITFVALAQTVFDYLEFEVSTTIDLRSDSTVPFPAVSICNQNKVHCLNLFTEYTKQDLKLKKHGSQDGKLNETVDTLAKLFNTSGCRNQVCTVCQGKFPMANAKAITNQTLGCLKARRIIECPLDANLGELECLLWLILDDEEAKEKTSVTGPVNTTEAIETLKCKTDDKLFKDACEFEPMPAPPDKKYYLPVPKSCPKKVEEGPASGPSSGPSSGSGSSGSGSSGSSSSGSSGSGSSSSGSSGSGSSGSGSSSSGSSNSGSSGSGSSNSGSSERTSRQKRSKGSKGGEKESDEETTDADFELEAEFLLEFMSLSKDVRAHIGHTFGIEYSLLLQKNVSSFISACTYKGVSCLEEKYWHVYPTAGYGNCYTFNAERNTNDANRGRKATLTGNLYGLKIEVFLDQENYMLNKLSKRAGARVIVHDPQSPPLADEYGLDVRPNTASSIPVQLTEITRQAKPYQPNCTSFWNETNYEIEESVKYTLAGCKIYCLQTDIVKQCNCFHPNLVQPNINDTQGTKPCLITHGSANYTCFNEVMELHSNLSRNCSCNVACQ